MAATASSNPDEDAPLPRGVARIPLWWMEITPHNILDLEREEFKRQLEYEESMMYAELARKDDYAQQYGDGGMDYDPSKHGTRDGSGGGGRYGAGGGGYQRGEDGKWKNPPGGGGGAQGRQFQAGDGPPGYRPGNHGDGRNGAGGEAYATRGGGGGRYAGGGSNYASGLNETAYGQYGDKDLAWEKPSWTKIKLRSTGQGGSIRQGRYDQSEKPITFATLRPTGPKEPKLAAVVAVAVASEAATPKESAPPKKVEPEKPKAEEQKPQGLGRLVKRIRRRKVQKRRSTKPKEGLAAAAAGAVAKRADSEAAPVLATGPKAVAKSAPAAKKATAKPAPVKRATATAVAAHKPAPAPAPKPAPAPAVEEEIVEEIEEEYYDEDEEYIEEEYSEEEYVEEIILEDEDGNEIVVNGGDHDVNTSTHDVTELQATLSRKARELKLLEEQMKFAPY
jgi:hypothetical protein